jgi:hypothetical protein
MRDRVDDPVNEVPALRLPAFSERPKRKLQALLALKLPLLAMLCLVKERGSSKNELRRKM